MLPPIEPSPPGTRPHEGTELLDEPSAVIPDGPGVPARVGRFEVRRLLGAGAFGRVYEAFDPVLQRAVAPTVARPSQVADEALAARFHREARAAAGLMHPHIVAVFDSGQDGAHHYIASALVPGGSLASAVREGRPLPLRQAAAIVR